MLNTPPRLRFGASPARFAAAAERVPPPVLFVTSAVFHYFGPACAVLLFARVDVLGVAWLRIASAAVVFAVWRRPWRVWGAAPWRRRRQLLALGTVLGVMNSVFYLALDRLPLGTVGAIEFLGPVLLAAVAVRTGRNLLALVLAGTGVCLLTDAHLVDEPLGLALAFANCVLFTLYVILGHRLAQDGGASGIDRLGASMLIATIVVAPVGIADAAGTVATPALLAAAFGVGICSSVIPYVCDQLAMARISRATFALMSSLLPATAAITGIVVLAQIPSPLGGVGIALIVTAVAIHHQRSEETA
ncbi:EamA family transporter [Embleya sp. AB8]|uniref:EamA family transporter n=1 Tax=Embleya sp. AB8 TaxID=3156304 RepID=UPI003C74189E